MTTPAGQPAPYTGNGPQVTGTGSGTLLNGTGSLFNNYNGNPGPGYGNVPDLSGGSPVGPGQPAVTQNGGNMASWQNQWDRATSPTSRDPTHDLMHISNYYNALKGISPQDIDPTQQQHLDFLHQMFGANPSLFTPGDTKTLPRNTTQVVHPNTPGALPHPPGAPNMNQLRFQNGGVPPGGINTNPVPLPTPPTYS